MERKAVIYVEFDILIQELGYLGVYLSDTKQKLLRSALFAQRVSREIKPTKKIKDSIGDWNLMNDTLWEVRMHNKHATASKITPIDVTRFCQLKLWTEGAENLVTVFKRDRKATYRRFCELALELMGNNYGLNRISSYLDKIYSRIEIEYKVMEWVDNPEALKVAKAYADHYRLSPKFKSILKDPENFIHIINLVEKAQAFEIEPVAWLDCQLIAEAQLGRTLNLAFSYNSIAVDRVAKISNLKNVQQDEFLEKLNRRVNNKK